MRWGSLFTLLFLLVAVSSVTSQPQVPDDKLIVPGERIGKWTLEMSIKDLEAGIGKANSVRDLSNVPDTFPTILYFWPNGLVSGTRDRSKVEYLYVTPLDPVAAEFMTQKAIAYRSSRDAVLAAYGRPTATTISGPFMARLVYDEIGLAVAMTLERVSALMVFRPGTGKSNWKF